MDLAGAIDLSQISLNFDGLPQLDLGQILSGLTLNVSEDGMQELASSLMEAIRLRLGAPGGGLFPFTGGFRLLHQFHGSTGNPAAPHPEPSVAGGGVSITQEQIQELIQRIFKGYQAYLIKMGYTDPEQFDLILRSICRPKKLFRSSTTGFPR